MRWVTVSKRGINTDRLNGGIVITHSRQTSDEMSVIYSQGMFSFAILTGFRLVLNYALDHIYLLSGRHFHNF